MKQRHRIMAACAIALGVHAAVGTSTRAQSTQKPSPPAGQDAAQAPSTDSAQAPSTDSAPGAPAGSGQGEAQCYTYDPGTRRDPFVSLLRSGTDAQGQTAGMRPAGLAGLTAAEVALKGTMQSRNGFVALVQGSDNKTYIVRPGDKLLDGTVRTITATTMVILQQVSDPLSLQKEREVRKVLRQADEVK
jgi:Tfp pilus assembly protein PilP